MKIQYHNIYTHFIFITRNRARLIFEDHRERIEKYISGIVHNNDCRLYSIYANPEHIHFLASRAPRLSEQVLATIVADSSSKFINDNKLCRGFFYGKKVHLPFQFPNLMWIEFANTSLINRNITEK